MFLHIHEILIHMWKKKEEKKKKNTITYVKMGISHVVTLIYASKCQVHTSRDVLFSHWDFGSHDIFLKAEINVTDKLWNSRINKGTTIAEMQLDNQTFFFSWNKVN